MRGFYFNKGDSFSSELGLSKDGLRLLAKQGNLEIMQQHIVKGAVVWLVPGESKDDLDFFYVHSGRIDIITDELNESFAPGRFLLCSGSEGRDVSEGAGGFRPGLCSLPRRCSTIRRRFRRIF